MPVAQRGFCDGRIVQEVLAQSPQPKAVAPFSSARGHCVKDFDEHCVREYSAASCVARSISTMATKFVEQLPPELKGSLPTVEEIEAELTSTPTDS